MKAVRTQNDTMVALLLKHSWLSYLSNVALVRVAQRSMISGIFRIDAFTECCLQDVLMETSLPCILKYTTAEDCNCIQSAEHRHIPCQFLSTLIRFMPGSLLFFGILASCFAQHRMVRFTILLCIYRGIPARTLNLSVCQTCCIFFFA